VVVTAVAPARVRDGRAQVPLSLLVLVGFIATLWWRAPQLAVASVSTNAWIALLSGVLTMAAIAGRGPGRWLSVAGVYFIVFAVFHLGIAPMLALGWDVPDFGQEHLTYWLDNLPIAPALYAVAVGTASYGGGVRVGSRFGTRSRLGARDEPSNPLAEERAAVVGLTATVIGVVGWLGFTLSTGGLGVFFGSYAEFRDVTETGPLPYLNLMIGLGAALWAVAPSHHWSRLARWFLGAFAVLAALIGLRSSIMFPAAAAVAVLVKSGRVRPNPWKWVLIFVAVLSAVSLIRSVRMTGVSGLDRIDINPAHGLAELGYSLRPIAVAIDWQNSFDEPARGRTYLRPVERLLAKPLPIIDVPPATEDPYIMNVVVAERAGQIGFSPVAEGFVNFGIAGVAGYMALVGIILGFLDSRPNTISGLVLSVVVLVPLLIQTRNSFVPVILNLLIGFAVWVAVFRPRRFGRRPGGGLATVSGRRAMKARPGYLKR
jgi:hypothetical protein